MIALWLSLALAGAPVHLGECQPAPALLAVDRFEQMLVRGTPASEVAFADCLAELGLLHSAQRHYLQVVRSAPGPARYLAVDRAMALVDHLGDPHSVQPYVVGIDPRKVPPGPGHDALFYVHGTNLVAEGRPELAAVRLDEVHPDSRWAAAARFTQARAIELAGDPDTALAVYGSVDEEPLATEAAIRRAALLATGGRLDEALDALARVDPDGPRGGFAATTIARLLLDADRVEDAHRAARRALKLARRGAYAPDAELVVAEVAAARCRVAAARRHLRRFHARWDPVALALDAAGVGNTDGLVLYARWYGGDPVDWGLPEPVLRRALDRDLARARLAEHLDALEDELAAIAAIPEASFHEVVAPHLERVVEDGRQQLRYLIGEALGRALADLHREITAASEEADRLEERIDACRQGT